MNNQTVFVVDDDEAVRDGWSILLESAGYRAKLFEDAESFLDQFDPEASGCIILDLNLPGMSGPELQQALIQQHVHLPIIFLTAHGDIPTSVRAIKAGAEDFLTKPVDGAALLACVKRALLQDTQRQRALVQQDVARSTLARLSEREIDVLKLAVQGKSNKEIGKELGISYRTVEVHRARILLKTSTSKLLELSALARASGLLTDR